MTTVNLAGLPSLITRYQHRLEAVVKQSAHDIAAEAQRPKAQGGRLPVDTGFLRNSFSSSLMGGTALSGPDSYVIVAAGMRPGIIGTFGWTAGYARHVEYGTSRMRGQHYLAGAVDQWPSIVRKAVTRAVAEIGG